MQKIILYLARGLAVIIVLFFAVFILEGLGPDFGWHDSMAHLVLTLAALVPAVVSFKRPKIGGWLFIVFAVFIFFLLRGGIGSLIIAAAPLVAGILFLIYNYSNIPPSK